MTFIQPANRIADIQPYFFVSLNQTITALREQGLDVIRLDMGSPDLPPVDFIVDALVGSAQRSDTHGYSPNGGTPEFRKAVAGYYQRRFNVTLDPKKEIVGLIGSKEGLFNLSQVLLNPGDLTLIPDPGYPVYEGSAHIAGAEIYRMPLLKENGFLPDLEAIPAEAARRAKLMWLNYPNNPTGAVAPLSFFEKTVEFARRYEIVIAHDAPYTDVCFDNYQAPSLLSVPGAKDLAVEFNSFSKTYNMAGWRLGMVAGNAQVIEYLNTYKSQMDSSQFKPIIDAGIAALNGDQSWLDERNQIYQYRRDIVLQGLREAGFKAETPPAAIYVWAQLPANWHDSAEYCRRLLAETGVSITPGKVYGEYGEGYIRISLGTATNQMKEAMRRIVAWTKNSH